MPVTMARKNRLGGEITRRSKEIIKARWQPVECVYDVPIELSAKKKGREAVIHRPSEEDWAKIQKMMGDPDAFSIEDVWVARPWAANTLPDRVGGRISDDLMRTLSDTVPAKSLLIGHQWAKLGEGLLFDSYVTEDPDTGLMWLRPAYYIVELDDVTRTLVAKIRAGVVRHVSIGFYAPLIVSILDEETEELLYEEYRNDHENDIKGELVELSLVYLGAIYGSEHVRHNAVASGFGDDPIRNAALQHAFNLSHELKEVARAINIDLLVEKLEAEVDAGWNAFDVSGSEAEDVDLADVEKPYPNEHACRLKDPGQYERFRRQKRKHNGKEYSAIIGFKKGGGSEDQAYRYPKATWEADEARGHCKGKKGHFEAAKKAEKPDKVSCECIKCGYTMETEKHCNEIKCPKCGGEMRREERPGPGKTKEDVHPASFTPEDVETVKSVFEALMLIQKILAKFVTSMNERSCDPKYRSWFTAMETRRNLVISEDDPDAVKKLAAELSSTGRFLLDRADSADTGMAALVEESLKDLLAKWQQATKAEDEVPGELGTIASSLQDLQAALKECLGE